VNRALQIAVGAVALGVIAVCVALLAHLRVEKAVEYRQPYRLQTYGGTNYVVRLQETVVGRTEHGYVIIVYARIENPNAHELRLHRHWFVLADHNREYHLPSTTGTQSEWIVVAAHGASEREMLSFFVGENALAGPMLLQLGQNFWVALKGEGAFRPPLRVGEFRAFQRKDW
jgi:hypothetical protein